MLKTLPTVLILLLFINTNNYAQLLEDDYVPANFYPGAYTLMSKETKQGNIRFDRQNQKLLVLDEDVIQTYTAHELISFKYIIDGGTAAAKEQLYVTWLYQTSDSNYKKSYFFKILATYSNCAIVSKDRAAIIKDENPDDKDLFTAKVVQGISYHLILPDGSISDFDRYTADDNLKKILAGNYEDVMLYSYQNGLQPTRLNDFKSMLEYAETLNLP